jgi:hypothetical protein
MSTQQVNLYDALSSLRLVAPNLWEIDQCFSSETVQRLISIPNISDTEFRTIGLKKRLELGRPSSHCDFIDSIGKEMEYKLSQVVDQPLFHITSKYWIDLPAFGCQEHYDSKDIFVSYQVYLSSSLTDEIRSKQHRDSNQDLITLIDENPSIGLSAIGAEFSHVSPPVQIQFRPNHGYLNLNSDLKLHKVQGSWDTRLSVMFRYSRV